MEKSSARNGINETSSQKYSDPHKKTAEELVDEMFDAVSLFILNISETLTE